LTFRQLISSLVFLCVLSICALSAVTENPDIVFFSINEGLPSKLIYDQIQDRKGYMWFATDNGVSRFDGKRFWNYKISDGLTDLDILRVYEDSKGRIWFIALNGSASYWYENKIYNESDVDFLAQLKLKSGIQSIAEDKDGNIWFGGIADSYAVLENNEKLTVFKAKLPSVLFSKDEFGNLILSNKGNLSVKTSNGFVAFETIDVLGNTLYSEMNMKANMPMFIGHEGFTSLDATRKKKVIIPAKVLPLELFGRVFSIDRNGCIYVQGTDGGVFFIKYDHGGFAPVQHLFPEYRINRVFTDDEGNTWMGTVNNGVMMIAGSSTNIELTRFEETDLKRDISALCKGVNSDVFVRNHTGAVGVIQDNQFKLIYQSPPPIFTTTSALVFGNKVLYWSCQEGVLTYSHDSYGKVETFLPEFNNRIDNSRYRTLLIDNNGDLYASHFGILKVDKKTGYLMPYLLELIPRERLVHPFFDSNNHLWYEFGDELIQVQNDSQLVSYKDLRLYFRGKITGIDELSDHSMLIATYGNGLHILSNGKRTHSFNVEKGLRSDLCRHIYVQNDTILVSGDKGLSILKYDQQALHMIGSITKDDGLSTNEIKCAIISQGKYFVGTELGLYTMPITFSQRKSTPPRLYLNSLLDLANNGLNELGFELMESDANVFMDFSAVTFSNAEAVSYRYRLRSKDNWSASNSSEYRFTSLGAGSYEFEIQARKANSDWSPSIIIPFKINLPWYKQLWVISSIVTLLGILIVWLVLRFYRKRNEDTRKELLRMDSISRERLRIAADVHDDLGADLSNLLLESRMEAINPNISESERWHLQRTEVAAQSALEKVDEIIWSLDPREDNLEDFQAHLNKYFDRFVLLSSIEGHFLFATSEDHVLLSSGRRRQIFLCVKEILHNIQKHAKASEVSFIVRFDRSGLIIKISDNGVGFPAELISLNNDGNGLNNIAARMSALGGFYAISNLKKGSEQKLTLPSSAL
jgi:signal transduction histidine kinase/ligand-binding sensor domain-containing protein